MLNATFNNISIIRVFWWLMPLSKTVFHIHLFYLPQVLGPMANNSQELFGDYTPNSNPIYGENH
jgi:hypothetical protein